MSAPNDRSSVGARILRFSGSRRTSRGPRRRASHRRGLCRGRKAKKNKITAGRKGVHILYYGLAESVIIAGPRNAHRRPLIPPLAILFSSLLARAPCRPQGTFPPGPCARPSYRAPSPFAEASCLCFSSSVSARHDERAHSVIIIGSRSRTARVPRISFSLFFLLSSLRVDKL